MEHDTARPRREPWPGPGRASPRRQLQRQRAEPHRGHAVVDRLDLAVEDVGLADEIGHEGVGRRVVELARRAVLGDDGIVHDDDAVGHRQRLFLIVRDIDDGQAELLSGSRGSPRARGA